MNDAGALARLVAEMEGPPFHGVLRPEAVEADAESGRVVVRLPFRPEFGRARGDANFHGGVIAALIDLTGHAAVAVKVGHMVPTIDLRVDYLRAASGEAPLVATGRVLRAGRSIATADVEVKDGSGRLVAAGRGVFSVRAAEPKAAPAPQN